MNNVQLTIVTQANGEGLKALLASVAQFESKRSDVQVHIEQANGNYEVLNRLKSGEPGDLVQMSESVFGPYLRDGFVVDLLPFLQRDNGLSQDDFYRGALEGPSANGELAALPIDIHVPFILFRKKAFAEVGIPEPDGSWTIEQFRETALQLTGEGRYGFRLHIDIEWFEPFVLRGGGAYLSADGSTAQGYLNSPETAAALQEIVDWFRVHKIVPMPGEVRENAFSERFAMNFDFSWCIPHVLHNHAGEYGAVGLPCKANGRDTNMMYMGGYGISSGCEHPDAAWELLKELSVPPSGRPLSQLPPTKPLARRLGSDISPFMACALGELDKATKSGFYLSQKWNANRQIVNQDLKLMITDGIDVRSTLEKWAGLIG
ncbi:extracellular solute-binding protein [Paenibacillus mesophilus]|uniref:extracellular solute-binding protein n=1 Tax=Paenibacillus mesophilus TaxID=2582849 RepID=UPI0013053F4F|nr:extracellular solute-binding protein [Paenibacillus mesophilus]